MKTHKVEVNGIVRTLRGMEQGVKEDVADIVWAAEVQALDRRYRKNLIDGAQLAAGKQLLEGFSFASFAVVKHLQTQAGRCDLIRAMVELGPNEAPLTDADLSFMAEQATDSKTPVGAVFQLIMDEAYPKKKTTKKSTRPSTDPASPTSGEPSSATNHSTSTPNESGG